MAIYYPSGCDDLLPGYVCDPCEDVEQGGIRSVAFIKNTFEFTDPSNPTEWQTGFDNGDIVIIPETRGTYDGGAEQEGPGFGDQATRVIGYNHTLTFDAPNYKRNCDFFNILKNSRQYKFAYRTGSSINMVDVTVGVIPKAPVAQELTSDVVWNVTVKWSSPDSPCPYDVPPGIFDACVVNV